MKNTKFDVTGFILDYEWDVLSDEEIVWGFQHMINDGTVWRLQGIYGKTAKSLIDEKICKVAGKWTPEEAVKNFIEYFLGNH